MTDSRPVIPVAPPVPPGSGTPAVPQPEFTELTTRRLGPVRAYFVRHPVVMDVLVMAWFGVPALFSAMVIGTDVPGFELSRAQIVTALGCMLAAAVALWWRRRAPVVTLVVITALAAVAAVVSLNTNGLELATAFCVYAVAASGGARRSWAAFGGATLVLVAALLWGGAVVDTIDISTDDGIQISTLTYQITGAALILILNLVALAIGTGVYNRRQHVSTLIERGNRLALERDQREQLAVVAERSRIARELHDVVAHSLTVMVTLSDGAAGIAERDPARARTTMLDVSETGRTALADMRRVLGVLRNEAGAIDEPAAGPGLLQPAPTQGVDELVTQFRAAGLAVAVVHEGAALPGDSGLRLAVYRIVQEALTNVLRYAPLASEIRVRLERTADAVVVEVSNTSGPGTHTPAEGGGRGLIGMRERVAVFRGTLDAGPTATGWRVRAVLPWEDET
ncbi:two-component sensor histidine kinase [Serinibacter arcticus]|uniref:histidine kinase n=1 Tax=Serinibacter arcticus TaxID=1655435 RepID=A0A2U1ZYF2_9MICO|nr:histidine kinase [Serinibacter arcticus]PWD51994.1 two-component sensor histidine kinase [Serinibacter arcticus]